MNTSTIIIGVLIAAAFVGWPIVGSYSKISGPWVSVIVFLSGTLSVTILSMKQLETSTLSAKGIILLTLAGAINGIAVYFYTKKIADPAIHTASLIILVSVSMAVLAPLLDWMIKGSTPDLKQICGFAMATGAIYLLSK